MKITNLSFLFFIASTFAFFSCQKETSTEEFTKVEIQMPILSKSDKINTYAGINPEPSTIDDINCFAILVSGSETQMNRTSCEIKDSSGTILNNKTVGLIRGLVQEGKTISMDVPAGSNRSFLLVGFKADPITSCVSFSDPYLNLDYVSNPYIIGKSALVNLEPGQETSVRIAIASAGTSIASNYQIGECYGPDAIRNKKPIATQARVVKENFPYNAFTESVCNTFQIQFTNDQGILADIDNAVSMTLQVSTKDASNTWSGFTNVPQYNLGPNCAATITGSTVFAYKNTRSINLSFTPSASTTVTAYQFKLINFTNNFIESTSSEINNLSSNYESIDMLMPRKVLPNKCYPNIGLFKTLGHSYTAGVSYTVSFPDFQTRYFNNKFCRSNDASYPTDAEIQNGGNNSVTFGDSLFDYSTIFSHPVGTRTVLSLYPLTVTASGTNMYLSQATSRTVEVVGGSNNPTYLRPDVPQSIKFDSGKCHGPFQIIIENERSGAVPVDSGDIDLTLSSPTHLGLYRDVNCANSYFSSLGLAHNKVFYIKTSGSTPSVSTPYTLTISGTVTHPDTGANVSLSTSHTIKVVP